ncbi:MAG: hypothetical protein R6U96_15185 [Promethearchaeia archaeon]
MSEEKSNLGELKCFTKIPSSEITIQEEDIFYRPKYNEVINYFKYLLTIEKNELEYGPNGLLLITSPYGTDIVDYLKLISQNYYLDFFQLNFNTIQKENKKFPQKLGDSLKKLNKKEKIQEETQENKEEKKEENKKEKKTEEGKEEKKRIKLLVIDEKVLSEKTKGKRSFLEKFFIYLANQPKGSDLLKRKVIMVWVNYDKRSILRTGSELFQFFDLYLKIPKLTESEREVILNTYIDQNEMMKINIEQVLPYMHGWEVKDINNILKVAKLKYQINSDLTDETGDITSIIIDLIKSGEFFPISMSTESKVRYTEKKEGNHSNQAISDNRGKKSHKKEGKEERIKTYISSMKEQKHSEFMLNQLYEDAASKNYDELLLIIEKMKDNEPLGENSRKILGKFPFILNDPPKQALVTLEKAKKRIDHIRGIYKE